MAAWVCTECTTTYSVGAPCCPHCGSTDYREQGAEMPKITRHGGPTNKFAEDAKAQPDDAPSSAEDTGEGEQPSVGSSSETFTGKQPTKSEPSEPVTPKPARMTASRSKKAATAKGSTARSTAGGQEDGTSATDSAAESGEG